MRILVFVVKWHYRESCLLMAPKIWGPNYTVRCALPWPPNKVFKNLQSSHSCKLNTIAWVVELTYLHVVVKCESLLGGHSKARCTVKQMNLSHTTRTQADSGRNVSCV